jgi:hypothetical protein
VVLHNSAGSLKRMKIYTQAAANYLEELGTRKWQLSKNKGYVRSICKNMSVP